MPGGWRPSTIGAAAMAVMLGAWSWACVLVMDTDFEDVSGQAPTGVGGTGGSGGACEAPVSGTCDTFPQCGCSADQSCDVYSTAGATSCFPSGNIAAGHVCASKELGECAPGLTCVASSCKAFCDSGADCPMPDSACFLVTFRDGDVDVPIPGMQVCTDQCDLADPQSICGPGATCFPFSDLGASPGQSICAVTGGSSTGDCAQDPLACAPGHICTADGRCHRWCRRDAADCGADACLQITNSEGTAVGHFVGTIEFGVCP